MADEVWVQELDASQVVSAANSAVAPVQALEAGLDRVVEASAKAGEALGQLAQAATAQAQAVQQSSAAIYEFADTYDLIPSKFDNLVTAQQRLNISANQIVGSWGATTQSVTNATGALDGNYSSTVKLSQAGLDYVRSTGAARGGASAFGNQLLTLGRLVDDARYGLQGIANNLVEINPLLGIVAIAGGILAQRFDDIQKAAEGTSLEGTLRTWKGFFDQNIQWAGEFLGLLDSATEKAAKVQSAEALKATGALAGLRSAEQEAAGRATTEVIKRFGGGTEVLNLLQGADLVATQANPRTAEAQRAFQERLAIDLQAATRGDQGAIQRIGGLAGGAPGRAALFGQELQAQIARTSPEAAEAAKQEQQRIDRESREAARANAEADKEAAQEKKRQQRLIEELNKSGEENQRAGEEVARKQDEKARRDATELASTAAGTGAGAAQISRLLQSQGIDKETADRMAAEASQGVGLRSALRAGAGARNVDVYGSADYLSRVQTAVGGTGDNSQRQLQEQIAMNQKLQQLLENTKRFGLSANNEATF